MLAPTEDLCDFSQVDLTILVLDVNDNAPVFQRRDYGVTVPEDVAVGTEVLRVLATSVDIGPNAEITYRIRSGNELGKFVIDRNSGEWRSFCGQSTCVKLDPWSGWRRVSGVIHGRSITARGKEKIYKAVVKPAMMYEVETAALSKRQEAQPDVEESKMLRFL